MNNLNEVIRNRSELLFLYDVKWANPNGDPLEENKPRIDEETERCIVSDVRLKRTIRDELMAMGETIWVSGEAVTPDERAKELEITSEEDATKKCIDVRLFGGVMPIKPKEKGAKGQSINLTGPVQFRFGMSLHPVKVVFMQGTAAFTSEAKAEQRSFREEYVIPYALICFYGVANENSAKKTNLTEQDMQKLLKAMWNGTKNLITRSKMEHNPRLLLRIIYKEGQNFHIGELDSYISFVAEKSPKELRDISDLQLDVTMLMDALGKNKDKIEKVQLIIDERLKMLKNNSPTCIVRELQELGIKFENIAQLMG
ncbi:type I-B CRISPR-associated protein Cas7/Csh2 [Pseudothermotoga thermarum]|uniref:CRISPR-associated protein, Csh2 family n=1 Tax=Pseudothermotoga thermarum DSM 5069 TaxID=688269 RepID=F7YXE4_9THEM|nr:type I-B CRISPR-associated protein Cas7/Csh2 [Pseudothermotoga thermarum]AEH51741.1 CRISPR-associated protein, Csh2 family [Pseudothermotoga thermarum DSM 5069]